MIPDAGAGRDEVPNVYGSAHEGRDAKDNLQVGSLVPDAGAGMGIGFEGAYGSEWEGRGLRRNHRFYSTPSTRTRLTGCFTHRAQGGRKEIKSSPPCG